MLARQIVQQISFLDTYLEPQKLALVQSLSGYVTVVIGAFITLTLVD